MATIDQDLKKNTEQISQKYSAYNVGQLDDSELKKKAKQFKKVQDSSGIDSTNQKKIIDQNISSTQTKVKAKKTHYEQEKNAHSDKFTKSYKENLLSKVFKNFGRK